MMYISLSFTTKGTGFTNQHKAAIINLINACDKEITLVHSFASREFLNKRNIATDVIDFFDKIFKNQISFFNTQTNQPMREMMFQFLKSKGGKPYFIGDTEAKGVKEELEIVEKLKFDWTHFFDLYEFSEEACDVVFFE